MHVTSQRHSLFMLTRAQPQTPFRAKYPRRTAPSVNTELLSVQVVQFGEGTTTQVMHSLSVLKAEVHSSRNVAGGTGANWHMFHFLIFYNFCAVGTEIRTAPEACVVLRLHCRIQTKDILNNVSWEYQPLSTSASVPT
jgi:hypothetical protein